MDALSPVTKTKPQNDLVHDPSTNNPPDNINSVLAEEAVDKEIAVADKWAATVPKITTLDQANRAKDAIDRLKALWDKYETERKEEKRPHDDRALAVQKRWRPILHKVEVCVEAIKTLRDDWLDREDARLKMERAAALARAAAAQQEAEEAAARVKTAAAPVSAKLAAEGAAERAQEAVAVLQAIPDRARVKGSFGRPAASLREYWFAEVTDVLKAARHYRDRPELREVLVRLASADARTGVRNPPEGSGIPGCNILSRKE